MIRASRNIIKLLQGQGESLEDYRYYVIARHHFSLRSGIFSLDEFCDILHSDYDYASLHNRPGNDRTKFKKKLSVILQGSILFAQLLDGRFKSNSESGLLSKYNKGNNRSMWFEIADKSVLSSKKAFFDFCVGCLLAGNKFRANKNIAEQCDVSVRRIQFATSSNNKKGTFIKRYNFLEDFSGPKKDVEKFRAILFNVHGISSPLPKKINKVWVMRLNAPNTYRANTLCGIKGERAQPMAVRVRNKDARSRHTKVHVGVKEATWFIPAIEMKKAELLFDYSDSKRWIFNDSVYNTDSYIQAHSKHMS